MPHYIGQHIRVYAICASILLSMYTYLNYMFIETHGLNLHYTCFVCRCFIVAGLLG